MYKESVEVANILKEMLDDIDTRRKIIDKVMRHIGTHTHTHMHDTAHLIIHTQNIGG